MPTQTEELTDDRIETGLAGGDTEPARGDRRDEPEFDFEKQGRHRAFKTKAPGASDEDLHADGEKGIEKPSRGRRTLVFAAALLLFLGVVGVGLSYLLSKSDRKEVQVGSTEGGLPGSRQAEAKRQSAEALDAVTESAAPRPDQPPAKGGGDLSQPVTPDPLAAATYPPGSANPYAPGSTGAGAQPATTEGQTGTTSTAGTSTAPEVGARQEQVSVSSAPAGGSFYLFRRTEAPRPTAGASALEAGPSELPVRPTAPGSPSQAPTREVAAPVKPPFGTMLPVRLLDSVMTLRDGGVVRMETTRAVGGSGGWQIPRGTTLVAKLAGGNNDRAYLTVVGFLDAGSNRLVSVGGEVKGVDGAAGVKGVRKRVQSRWAQGLKEAARAGVSLGSAFLIGRRGGGGYYPPPSSASIPQPGASSSSAQNANLDFIYVAAGAQAFVMITELPPTIEGRDADSLTGAGELSDEELANLLTAGTPAQIRAALPRMNPELRSVAERILAQEEGPREGKK